jgi:metal-responsive CopG/Arc/MetJ family transcriptional regulator
MKTIQMTIDEPLLTAVDKLIADLNTTRSAFIRDALILALQRYKVAQLEQKHAEGYARHPVKPNEFDAWETEQAWGES